MKVPGNSVEELTGWPKYTYEIDLLDNTFRIPKSYECLLNLSFDAMTPYFKTRFFLLPRQEQCLLTALCVQEQPVSQSQLAHIVGADRAARPGVHAQAVIARAFSCLVEKGAVVKVGLKYAAAPHVKAWYRLRMRIVDGQFSTVTWSTPVGSLYAM